MTLDDVAKDAYREVGIRAMFEAALDVVAEHARDTATRVVLKRKLRDAYDRLCAPRCRGTLENSYYKCGTFGQYCSEACWNKGKDK